MHHRLSIGRFGEEVAASFLMRRGGRVEERNLTVGRGELDLVVRFGFVRVAVEVRTVRGAMRMDEQFPVAKCRQVSELSKAAGIPRVDLVGVALGPERIEIHWLRNVD